MTTYEKGIPRKGIRQQIRKPKIYKLKYRKTA